MFKICLVVLCFASYGSARLFPQETQFPRIAEPTKTPHCVCTDGTHYKTFNEDKFSFLNSLFPKENPITSFFESLKPPKMEMFMETFMKPFENMFPNNQNGLASLPLANNFYPRDDKNLVLQVPKVPEIKPNQDAIPTHVCTWPNSVQAQKSPANLQVNKVQAIPAYGVQKGTINTVMNNAMNRSPNLMNSVVPTNKNVNVNYQTKPIQDGSTLNPSINVPNFMPQNIFSGLSNLNPFNGLTLPNYNLGAGFNLPNLGAGLSGHLTNPFNINGALKMPNMNLGGGLNMKPYLGGNLNLPGFNINAGRNSNNMVPNYNPNMGGIPGVNLNSIINQNGAITPTPVSSEINFLTSLPKEEPNTSVTPTVGGTLGNILPAQGISVPAEISTNNGGVLEAQNSNTQDTSMNVNINDNTQEISMAPASSDPQSTFSMGTTAGTGNGSNPSDDTNQAMVGETN